MGLCDCISMCVYVRASMCIYVWPIGSVVDCSPMIQETGVQSQVESYQTPKKCYLMPLCLTLHIIKYGSRVSGAIQRKD